jgi:nucleotide-binding universal stress UspA family protein
MFKAILAPVAFDESSDPALGVACDLAAGQGARLILLHAYEPPIKEYAGMLVVPALELASDIAKAAHVALDAKVRAAQKTCPLAAGILREGTPWRCILDLIDEQRCDLVVMGTHGHRGLAHVVLGSVADKVVRLSPVPVMTVPGAKR